MSCHVFILCYIGKYSFSTRPLEVAGLHSSNSSYNSGLICSATLVGSSACTLNSEVSSSIGSSWFKNSFFSVNSSMTWER